MKVGDEIVITRSGDFGHRTFIDEITTKGRIWAQIQGCYPGSGWRLLRLGEYHVISPLEKLAEQAE